MQQTQCFALFTESQYAVQKEPGCAGGSLMQRPKALGLGMSGVIEAGGVGHRQNHLMGLHALPGGKAVAGQQIGGLHLEVGQAAIGS